MTVTGPATAASGRDQRRLIPPDAATVLEVMLDCWGEVFQPYFGDDKHWEVRQIVCNLRSIVSYYVGQRDGAECDYEPYEALGEIARLLRRFYIDHAARQVDEVKRELGGLMYGQSAAGAQSAAGDDVVVTKDALEALIADAVSLEVARQLRSELDRVGLRPLDMDVPPIPRHGVCAADADRSAGWRIL